MKEKSLGSIISTVVTVILSIVVIAGLFFYVKNKIVSFQADRTEQRNEHIERLKQLEQTDSESGRIILTQEYLAEEYDFYYNSRKSGNSLMISLILAVIALILAICIINLAVYVIKNVTMGNQPDKINIIKNVMPIPFVILFFFLASKSVSDQLNVEPENNPEIEVYKMDVTRKVEDTYTDSDGDTHTTYYIYFNDDEGKETRIEADSSLYSSVMGEGLHYIAGVRGQKGLRYFKAYQMEKYVYRPTEIN